MVGGAIETGTLVDYFVKSGGPLGNEREESETSGVHRMEMSTEMMFHYFSRDPSPGLPCFSCEPSVAQPLEVLKAEGGDELKVTKICTAFTVLLEKIFPSALTFPTFSMT